MIHGTSVVLETDQWCPRRCSEETISEFSVVDCDELRGCFLMGCHYEGNSAM